MQCIAMDSLRVPVKNPEEAMEPRKGWFDAGQHSWSQR